MCPHPSHCLGEGSEKERDEIIIFVCTAMTAGMQYCVLLSTQTEEQKWSRPGTLS